MAGAERLLGCAGGYYVVPAAHVGRWGRVHPGLNQGLGKGLGDSFRWRKLPREQLGGFGQEK